MDDFIITSHPSGILEWRINRPEKRNAVNFNVIKGLEEALDWAEKDQQVKTLVITGTGKQAFCSGGDLVEFHQLKTSEEAYSMLSKMGNLLYRLATFIKPTLALINGSAVGGGCEIATACDFRIAKKECKMGFIQGRLGITTGWGGASILYEKLPPHEAMKILLEANTYSTDQLKELGFVQEVFEKIDIHTAEDYLSHILKNHLHVLMCYKEALVSKWQHSALQSRMEKEIRNCSILWEKEEHHQAVEKFRTRKKE
nr:enoyl-CoA hydratase/isomerase family protein [Heyndrickxia oleronia]